MGIRRRYETRPDILSFPSADGSFARIVRATLAAEHPEIVKLGTELLEPRTSNSDDDLAYLTTVTAAAHIRMGEIAQARSLLQAQWRRFNHAGQFDLALRELLALTRSAGTETIAHAAP